MRNRKTLKTLKNNREYKGTCQHMHVQNHAYGNKSRHTYTCKLSNTGLLFQKRGDITYFHTN